jgi:O-antigen/teichoic acid export membrane protein
VRNAEAAFPQRRSNHSRLGSEKRNSRAFNYDFRSMRTVKIGTQIRQVTVFTVLIGFVSYAFNFVTARLLTPDHAAKTMTSWTVINLFLLIIQFPIELYAPRLLRSMSERQQNKLFDSLVLVYVVATSVLTLLLFLSYYSARYGFNAMETCIFTILIVSLSLFQIFRAINIAREELANLVRSALVLSFISFCLFVLILFLDINSTSGPLLATALGFTVAAIVNVRRTDITLHSLKMLFQNRVACLEIFSMKEIGALSLSNFVSLLLVSGGAVFTGVVGLSTRETVVYLGSIALALIPITVLHSTTTPVYLRAIKLFSEGNFIQIRALFVKTASVYFALSVAIVFMFWLVGEKLLLMFIGDRYQHSEMVLTLSSIAVCVAFAGSLPRIFLMAMGETRQTYKPLLSTAVLYITLIFSVRSGHVGLFTASIASSLLVSTVTFLMFQRNIRHLVVQTS